MINLSAQRIFELKKISNQIRQDIISMIYQAGSGHPGGSLGMADIFTALYFEILKHNPKNPEDPERDRLVLSNGHICPVQYASLAHAGYFPLENLQTLRKLESGLQGHPHRGFLPGIETTSGPLGSGLSQACGMAWVGKTDSKDWRVYCLMSDAEQDEGNTWEGVMFANKYKLNNLIAVIDRNNIQTDGTTEEVMPLNSLKKKYLAFGWAVAEIDGNNFEEILGAFEEAKEIATGPQLIIANTIPGKGVSFMENKFEWHSHKINKEEMEKALEELKNAEP
ncbi:MAG: transketolase [Candidatus Daviesbacteria bacterium]|nr:transketolase [Candidatus Daviesbacteria bacterium]